MMRIKVEATMEILKQVANELIDSEVSFTVYAKGLKMITIEPAPSEVSRVKEILKQFDDVTIIS
ncbi:hypothetical protein [Brevibacillus reuszeri]|uniref:hypothetical protein n=1 Tax=Brevibacillus reuszeri TaxID=54915 RepID=UPI003D1ABB57